MSWQVKIEALNLAPFTYLHVLSKTCILPECAFESLIVGGNFLFG